MQIQWQAPAERGRFTQYYITCQGLPFQRYQWCHCLVPITYLYPVCTSIHLYEVGICTADRATNRKERGGKQQLLKCCCFMSAMNNINKPWMTNDNPALMMVHQCSEWLVLANWVDSFIISFMGHTFVTMGTVAAGIPAIPPPATGDADCLMSIMPSSNRSAGEKPAAWSETNQLEIAVVIVCVVV